MLLPSLARQRLEALPAWLAGLLLTAGLPARAALRLLAAATRSAGAGDAGMSDLPLRGGPGWAAPPLLLLLPVLSPASGSWGTFTATLPGLLAPSAAADSR